MLSASFSGGCVALRCWGMNVPGWPAERLKAKWGDEKIRSEECEDLDMEE